MFLFFYFLKTVLSTAVERISFLSTTVNSRIYLPTLSFPKLFYHIRVAIITVGNVEHAGRVSTRSFPYRHSVSISYKHNLVVTSKGKTTSRGLITNIEICQRIERMMLPWRNCLTMHFDYTIILIKRTSQLTVRRSR